MVNHSKESKTAIIYILYFEPILEFNDRIDSKYINNNII